MTRVTREAAAVELSAAEARRIALAAQGFARPRPPNSSIRHVRDVAKRLGALQIDTVNVLVRAHYLPVFSRLGPYGLDAMDRLLNVRHELVELNAHRAALVPVELEPFLRGRRRGSWWGRDGWRQRIERERPGYVDAVERFVVERGPIAIGDLPDPGRRKKLTASELPVRRRDGKPYSEVSVQWSRSSVGKDTLQGLLVEGRLALAGRGPGFERLYDLTERVIPPSVLATPTPSDEDTRRELVRLSARTLGVATVADLASTFLLKVASARTAVRELVETGELLPARVEGWKEPAFLHRDAEAPETVEARALLSPFDSLTWNRKRTERLFGFEFSFEIYVPEAKRRYGYYVLPFLLGEELVARVDLKADRPRSTLLVRGAFAEPGSDPRTVLPALVGSLRETATWLGLERIEVGDRGDLARGLRRALSRGAR